VFACASVLLKAWLKWKSGTRCARRRAYRSSIGVFNRPFQLSRATSARSATAPTCWHSRRCAVVLPLLSSCEVLATVSTEMFKVEASISLLRADWMYGTSADRLQARAALEWALVLNDLLLRVEWHSALDDIEPTKLVKVSGKTIFRGLRAKTGIFLDTPSSVVPHGTTGRTDYFGTIVNRSARMMAGAQGGQILGATEHIEEALHQWREISRGCDTPQPPSCSLSDDSLSSSERHASAGSEVEVVYLQKTGSVESHDSVSLKLPPDTPLNACQRRRVGFVRVEKADEPVVSLMLDLPSAESRHGEEAMDKSALSGTFNSWCLPMEDICGAGLENRLEEAARRDVAFLGGERMASVQNQQVVHIATGKQSPMDGLLMTVDDKACKDGGRSPCQGHRPLHSHRLGFQNHSCKAGGPIGEGLSQQKSLQERVKNKPTSLHGTFQHELAKEPLQRERDRNQAEHTHLGKHETENIVRSTHVALCTGAPAKKVRLAYGLSLGSASTRALMVSISYMQDAARCNVIHVYDAGLFAFKGVSDDFKVSSVLLRSMKDRQTSFRQKTFESKTTLLKSGGRLKAAVKVPLSTFDVRRLQYSVLQSVYASDDTSVYIEESFRKQYIDMGWAAT
jgi:hypothetical protein